MLIVLGILPLQAKAASVVEFNQPVSRFYEDEGAAVLVIERSGDVDKAASVDYATLVDSVATRHEDFGNPEGTLSFAPGERVKRLSIPLLNDGRIEGTEYFNIVLTDASQGTTLGIGARTQVQILDNDAGVQFVESEFRLHENAGPALIRVRRGDDGPETIEVGYRTVSGAAKPGADYVEQSGTLTFLPGERIKTFSVPILNDSQKEPGEDLTVLLTGSSGPAGLGSARRATLWIWDNDDGVIFARGGVYANPVVAEDIGQLAVTVIRQGDFTDSAAVRCFTSDLTARAGTHYEPSSIELTFPPGELSKAWVIPIWDNPFVDGSRTLTLTIENTVNRAVLDTFILTIRDNETAPGILDNSFRPPAGVHRFLALQPDGRIVVSTEHALARLNPDGTRDRGFQPSGALGPPYVGAQTPIALVQPDGGIIVLGQFTGADGGPLLQNVRLQRDGTLDLSFKPAGLMNEIDTAVLQPDGKILIAGRFTAADGVPRSRIARLQADGSLDPRFDPGTGIGGWNSNRGVPVAVIALQDDGRILLGGDFGTYNGVARPNLARLNPDGSLDESFVPDVPPSRPVAALAKAPDGKLDVGYWADTVSSSASGQVLRLHANGSRDTSFASTTFLDSMLTAIAGQSDGKVLVAGRLAGASGSAHRGVARLNADGSLDAAFDAGSLTESIWAPMSVTSLALQPDGKILIGVFAGINGVSLYDPSSSPPPYTIARLLPTAPALNTIGFTHSPSSALESDGSAQITVVRRGSSERALSVEYATAEGSATPGVDYAAATGRVDFAPLEVEKAIRIPIADDKLPEADEIFQVVLSGFGEDTAPDYHPAAEVRIVDNERPGSIDTGFEVEFPDMGEPSLWMGWSPGEAVALDAKGRIYIGGHFGEVQGAPRGGVARLHPDGSLDGSFLTEGSWDVHSVLVQPDGKVIAGAYQQFTRLNPDGSVDQSYQPSFEGWAGDGVLLQSDGRMIAATDSGMQRYLPNGRVDYSFQPLPETWTVAAIQPDDSIVVARNTVTRFQANGLPDTSFQAALLERRALPGEQPEALALAFQPDRKILVAGRFDHVNEIPRANLARLNSDGSLDVTFAPAPGLTIQEWRRVPLAVQRDGKILVAGHFIGINGVSRRGIVRLNTDGSVDTPFDAGFGPLTRNGGLTSLVVQPDGRVLIAGTFGHVNGIPRLAIARLNGDRPLFQLGVRAGARPVRLVVTGPAGEPARIQRSENLREWDDWHNVTLIENGSELQVPDPDLESQRFYRVVSPFDAPNP